MDIHAIGPDMWLGKIGHFFIILAFISGIVASISYWLSASHLNTPKEQAWQKMGRWSFILHGIAVFVIVTILFYLMASKKYVFKYVYDHASNDLPFRYLFAAFWEGQEGSTLLWAFWHVVLGLVALRTVKKWEAPVVGTISMVQVFLLSMVLGIYFWGYKVGANPFYLLKSSAANAPVFQANPDFVPKDGRGLNELLRNYWMVIHPPTVFLGFASITIPFGFAMGGLFWRQFKDWITPALPWALLAGGVLGIGVLMGGAWAYEALSFGGFWVWDPVENASLVPWLMIVAAIHLMLVLRATGYSAYSTFLLIIFSFLTVIYSTFLTKSGVLGDASVHSFADLGMSAQLVIFILFFWFFSFFLMLSSRLMRLIYSGGTVLLFALYLIIGQPGVFLFAFILLSFAMLFSIRDFPKKSSEEQLWSREFWLFIGSMALLISALHISLATSVPVYNKLFGTDYSVFSEEHFNTVQIWPAMLMVLLSAVVLYLQYKKSSQSSLSKAFGWPVIAAFLITILFVWIYEFTNIAYILLLLFSAFSLFANLNYITSVVKGNFAVSGASIAHIGFAVLLIGIVISQSKKWVVSKNSTANVNVSEDDEELNEQNVLLYENETIRMGDYLATFKEDVEGNLRDGVIVDFKKLDENEQIIDEFELVPKFKLMGDNSVADPAIRRQPLKDFFTHISLINLGQDRDTTTYEPMSLSGKQDTMVFDRTVFVLNGMKQGTTRKDISLEETDIAISADIEVITKDSVYNIEPVYLIRENQAGLFAADIPEERLSIRINEIKPESNEVELGIKSARPFKKYIALKAMIFPLINLVWLGSILMFIGFIMSLFQRYKQQKQISS